eukprot:354893-Chlamydomonas_euryale.AAC.2
MFLADTHARRKGSRVGGESDCTFLLLSWELGASVWIGVPPSPHPFQAPADAVNKCMPTETSNQTDKQSNRQAIK